MPKPQTLDIRSLDTTTGRVVLESGQEMQLVVTPSGAVGVQKVSEDAYTSSIDQISNGEPPPGYFDISGLDQVGAPFPPPTSPPR